MGGASIGAISAPMTSLRSCSRAARCMRTTPASELQSVTANASYPSSAARTTSSSGCEAPRRNEKFVRQCSSAYGQALLPGGGAAFERSQRGASESFRPAVASLRFCFVFRVAMFIPFCREAIRVTTPAGGEPRRPAPACPSPTPGGFSPEPNISQTLKSGKPA